MGAPVPVPDNLLEAGDFVQEVGRNPDAVVYFLCNVGDGDAQLILLPKVDATRQVIIVDAGITGKVPPLLRSLAKSGLISLAPAANDPIALVIATHPHQDHIGGMPEVLTEFGDLVAEFWEPGFYHAIPAYHQMLQAIEQLPQLLYAQPTSGLRRWIGNVAISVLSPSVQLRNRFDSYGTEINDSSISIRIEFPLHRVREQVEQGGAVATIKTRALVLGADAQTVSWSYALVDFPFLRKSDTAAAKAIAAAQADIDLLHADVLKVSHHCSKHGVNLELVERIKPRLTLISSVGGDGKFHFPHTISQELIREAIDPSTDRPHAHPDDFDPKMSIFYTSDRNTQAPLGSVGLVMSETQASMWRFMDEPGKAIDLAAARRWSTDPW